MKKILSLLMVSVALTSCFGNQEKSAIDEDTNENSTGVINIIEDDSNTEININEEQKVNEKSTGAINIVENDSNAGATNTSTTTIDSSNTKISPDEKALEDEVNDLLDEFIDSLDSYDK